MSIGSNLYVVDGNISDVEIILSAIGASEITRKVACFDFADDSSDVVTRISDIVAKHRELASLHIVSHGRPGALVSGATVIDANGLLDRADDLARIGAALAPGGDILLYGCDVAAGEEGRDFIGRLAELTGANVAASETPTGAADRGGDWRLEARVGSVTTPVLEVPAYPGILVSASAAPTIGGLVPVSVTEGGSAGSVGSGISISGGSSYGGGSITFKLTSPVAGDQFLLTSDSDPNAAGAISISGALVYYGTGSARIQIGVVDSVENGQNGQPLTIDFTRDFTNPSFENGTTGWTIGESRVILGTTSINGHVTPADTTIPPNAGDDAGDIQSMTYSSQLSTGEHSDGAQSLRLYNSGQTNAGYDVVHGPYAYSDTFAAVAGDTFYFDWRAAAGSDAYDAFGYLMNADTGAYQVVLNETGANASGNTPWATNSVTIPTSGNWFFVFVGGTYDFTGGTAVGGSLYIDNFRVAVGGVTDSIVAAVANHVSYQSTGDAALDDRTLQVVVSDSAGNQTTATTAVEVVNANDAPTGAVSLSGPPAQGRTLTATNSIADPDGFDPAGVSYQWQRLGSDGNWHNIVGATGDSYVLTQDDVRSKVRAVASYTDHGGTVETVAGAESRMIEDAHFAPTGGIAIGGTAAQGEALTLTDTVADADGIASSAYQWQRWDGSAWVDITGATGTSYVLTQADVGHDVRAELRYVDGDGLATIVSSAAVSSVANVNVAPTGGLAIGGTAAQGETLALTDTVADADGIASSAYQWQRWDGSAWVDISGATGTSYVLTQADVGHDVRAELRYVDGDGLATTVSSAALSSVADASFAPTGGLAIGGTTAQGETLTLTDTVADADGITSSAYQWQRWDGSAWVDISGATGTSYVLTQADVGHDVRAELRYVDGDGLATTVSSAATSAVTNVNFAPTGGLAIGGTTAQGETLTLTDTVADADGVASPAYQWQRLGTDGAWHDISGATGTSYVLTQADVGHDVRAELRYVDGDGVATTVSSAATSAVTNVNFAPTGGLAVGGTAAQGETLTLTDTVADADGIASPAYQWQRWDGSAWVDISGATGTSYVLTQADVGHDVRAELRYVDGDGLATIVSSATVSSVADVNDAPVGAVVANGAAVQGRTLTATNTVTDADGISTPGTYQWQRQGADGAWHDIVGATAATYALTQTDVGARMRAVLHYVDDAGAHETVAGAATGVVANINDLPVAQDDRFAEMRNARTVTIDVLANDTDPDGDALHVTRIDGHDIAPGGSVTLDSGTVTLDESGHLVFSPFLTFDGAVSFTYTAEDGAGGASVGHVAGSVATSAEWSALGHDLQDVVGGAGLALPSDLNDLIYAASVVLPGAFITSDDARSIVGYQPGAGLDLVTDDVLPDASMLSRMLLALAQTRDSSAAPVLSSDADGAWTSSVDQSLLFQTALGSDQHVRIDYGGGSTSFSGTASSGWTRSFALQSLRPDFSADLVTQSDGNAQGQLHEASVGTGSALSIDIGGLQAGTPQAGLSNKYGFVDFVTPDAHSAVAISRSVAVADTLGGADDQTAVVHMRQNGVSDVSVMFYKVDDLSGSIDGIDPGDARYGAATESRAYHLSDGGTWLQGSGYGQYGEGEIAGIDNGDIIAMRLHTGAGDDFYAFANANSDGQIAHLWGYGYNTWGWEDTAGGGDRDFNDLVVQLDFVGKQLDSLLLA
nr:DUF4347 domain-containing protein [Pseudoxanthobacter soli]